MTQGTVGEAMQAEGRRVFQAFNDPELKAPLPKLHTTSLLESIRSTCLLCMRFLDEADQNWDWACQCAVRGDGLIVDCIRLARTVRAQDHQFAVAMELDPMRELASKKDLMESHRRCGKALREIYVFVGGPFDSADAESRAWMALKALDQASHFALEADLARDYTLGLGFDRQVEHELLRIAPGREPPQPKNLGSQASQETN